MTSQSQVKPTQLTSLNALRGLAFIGVFLEHTKLLWSGAWGVSVFFVLSGFLMAYNYHNRTLDSSPKSIFHFAWKKVSKLYPLHIITLLAILPLCDLSIGRYPLLKNIFSNVFLLQSWSGNAGTYFSFNAVSWYLSTCFFLYLCFPFIHKCMSKYTNKNNAIMGIAFTLLLQLFTAYISSLLPGASIFSDNLCKWFTYIFPVYRLGDFIIGCNLGYLFLKQEKKQPTLSATFAEAFTILLTAVLLYAYSTQIGLGSLEWFRYTLLYTASSILLVYCFASNSGHITKLLSNKILIPVGNISAYAFLIHALVIRYINKLFLLKNGYTLSSWKLTLVAFAITLICSLFYMLMEKNLTRIIRAKHITN